MREIRCALRSLARTPALFVTAVISLALGIGANTAVFTVVNAMLFKPLPVQDPERLVALYTIAAESSFPEAFSYPDYLDYRGRHEVFADLVGHSGAPLSLAGGGDRPELVWGELVTGNYFTGLGVSPAEGYVPRSSAESTDALFTEVAPGYFATMGTRIVRGRPLDDRDRPGALRTAVVNEAMARKYWPGQDPIGRRFRLYDPNGTAFTIVGVAETGKYITLGEEATPCFFLPLWQNYASRVRIVLRTQLDPEVVAAGLRSELQAIDQSLPLFGIRTMKQFLERSLWGTGAAAGALGSLGLFVPVLAAVGIHGIVSWSVAQRTHEIGIRMALGASARSVRRSIVNQGLVLAIVGILLGSAGALALTRVLANLVFAVKPTDPFTFIAMALLLMSVALAAAYLPARRAALLDPARALRHE